MTFLQHQIKTDVRSCPVRPHHHHNLLLRMEEGSSLNWFRSYLSNRSQCVRVNNESSAHTKVDHGVIEQS